MLHFIAHELFCGAVVFSDVHLPSSQSCRYRLHVLIVMSPFSYRTSDVKCMAATVACDVDGVDGPHLMRSVRLLLVSTLDV